LAGKYAIRACILNHSTTTSDVESVLRWLETAPVEVPPHRHLADRKTAPVTAVWPDASGEAAQRIRAVPLLRDVDDRWVTWLANIGRRRHLAAGETVVRQWDVDRDFYLLLDGDADVFSGDRQLATMHAGDFFGELGALDWGASFGYPRLATVKARTDVTLLVLTDAQLAELMAAVPEVAARIRATAGQRASRV
jgi:hypothetical protein